MIFKKIRFKNFLSYGNVWTDIDLDIKAIVNIIGHNGKGKSTFIDALHYVLTGKPFRDINVGQLCNTINKKEMLVELEVEKGDIKIKVIRGQKPNIFDIIINGVSQNEANKTSDHQKTLERILNYNPKTLKHTIIMSSMNYTPFLRMKAADKRLFIDEIINVNVFTQLNDFTKKKFSILKTKISDIDNTIKTLEKNLELIEEMNSKVIKNSDEQIKLVQEKISSYENEIKELKNSDYSNIQTFKKQLEEITTIEQSQIQNLTNETNQLLSEENYKIENYKTLNENAIKQQEEIFASKIKVLNDTRKQKCKTENDDYQPKLEKHEAKLQNLKAKIHSFKQDIKMKEENYATESNQLTIKLTKIHSTKEDKKSKLTFLNNNSICPSCEREIDEQFKTEENNKLQIILNNLTNEEKNIQFEIDELQKTYDSIISLKTNLKDYESKTEDYQQKLYEFKEKHNEVINQIKAEYDSEYSNVMKENQQTIADLKVELSKNSNAVNEVKRNLTIKLNDNINTIKEGNRSSKQNLENQITTLSSKQKEDERMIRDREGLINDYQNQINRLQNPEIKEVKDPAPILAELNNKRKELEELNYRKKVFETALVFLSDKGFKSFVVKKYIPLLNSCVNYYLEQFEAHYRMKFDENMNETIVGRGYESLSYESFSSGEKARCDLSLLFAFLDLSKKKNSVDSNLLVLDEVADTSLDTKGVFGILSIITKLKQKGYTTFVISHKEEIQSHFDKTLEASKIGVFSELTEKE